MTRTVAVVVGAVGSIIATTTAICRATSMMCPSSVIPRVTLRIDRVWIHEIAYDYDDCNDCIRTQS